MIPSSTLLQLKDSFVDYSFDRAKSLINSQYESSAIWCLGGDLWGSTTTSNMTLPKYDEIVQGHNGDCFLVASIAALLAVNFDFTQIVSSKEKGKYEVKIFSEGGERGEVVIIDGLIPCGVGVGAIFAHSRNGDMSCFGVIEKAFAKFEGLCEFWRLKGGNVSECLYSLTGLGCEDLHDVKNWKPIILTNWNSKNPMGTGHIDTHEKGDNLRTNYNIRKNHAYAIVHADNNIVKIYNPHGNDDGFKGKKGGDGAGTLSFSWEEFNKVMNRLQVCPFNNISEGVTNYKNWTKEFTHDTAGGCSNFSSFRFNDVLIMKSEEITSYVTFMMGTNDVRKIIEYGDTIKYPEIGITIIKLNDEKGVKEDFYGLTPEKYTVIKKTRCFANKRETVLTLESKEVEKNEGYLGIIFSTYEPIDNLPYWTAIRSKNEIECMWRSTLVPKITTLYYRGKLGTTEKSTTYLEVKGVGRGVIFFVFLKGVGVAKPLGVWLLKMEEGGEYKVLEKPEFIKATETTWKGVIEDGGGGVVICPALHGSVKGDVETEIEVKVLGEGFEMRRLNDERCKIYPGKFGGKKVLVKGGKGRNKIVKKKTVKPVGFAGAKKGLDNISDLYGSL